MPTSYLTQPMGNVERHSVITVLSTVTDLSEPYEIQINALYSSVCLPPEPTIGLIMVMTKNFKNALSLITQSEKVGICA